MRAACLHPWISPETCVLAVGGPLVSETCTKRGLLGAAQPLVWGKKIGCTPGTPSCSCSPQPDTRHVHSSFVLRQREITLRRQPNNMTARLMEPHRLSLFVPVPIPNPGAARPAHGHAPRRRGQHKGRAPWRRGQHRGALPRGAASSGALSRRCRRHPYSRPALQATSPSVVAHPYTAESFVPRACLPSACDLTGAFCVRRSVVAVAFAYSGALAVA